MTARQIIVAAALALTLAGTLGGAGIMPAWVYVLVMAPVLEEVIKYKLPDLPARSAWLLLALLVLGEAAVYGYQLHAHGFTGLQILALRGPAVLMHLTTAAGHWAAWTMAQQTSRAVGAAWRWSFLALAIAAHVGFNAGADRVVGGWLS